VVLVWRLDRWCWRGRHCNLRGKDDHA
jgi:hypothetical protein